MEETEKISVIVPSYNTSKDYLEKLYNSLMKQEYQKFELIIVDDCSSYNYYDQVLKKDEKIKVIYKDYNSGPAASRNVGVENASGEYLFFTDSDCELTASTLYTVAKNLKKHKIIMGNTITKTETYFGRAVAYLGFPGGGILGFDNVWKVDENGYTDSISSCNLAIRRETFKNAGAFDTSFPAPGGEDTTFAKTVLKRGFKIKYCPEQVIYHVERGSFKSFIKWQLTRGKGNFHIKEKVDNIEGFFKLRIWSIKNSLCKAGAKYILLVTFLWFLSVFFQIIGYYIEKNDQ